MIRFLEPVDMIGCGEPCGVTLTDEQLAVCARVLDEIDREHELDPRADLSRAA